MPLIYPPVEKELHAYLGGICNQFECPVLTVGGFIDHVHILCMLSKKMSVSKLLEVLKKNSSRWIKTKGEAYEHFFWQDGYGAFSISPTEIDPVITYIKNQHIHHRENTFQTEYLSLLKEYNIDYDERYVWD